MYSVGSQGQSCKPFVAWVVLLGEGGERCRVKALFDGGALVGAIDSVVFSKIRHRLGGISQPTRRLRMANGTIVNSEAHWEGVVELAGSRETCELEVFPSKGGWDMLLGKPLLELLGVKHDFKRDVVVVGDVEIRNEHGRDVFRLFKMAADAAGREPDGGSESYAASPVGQVHFVDGDEPVDAAAADVAVEDALEAGSESESELAAEAAGREPEGGSESYAASPVGQVDFVDAINAVDAAFVAGVDAETDSDVSTADVFGCGWESGDEDDEFFGDVGVFADEEEEDELAGDGGGNGDEFGEPSSDPATRASSPGVCSSATAPAREVDPDTEIEEARSDVPVQGPDGDAQDTTRLPEEEMEEVRSPATEEEGVVSATATRVSSPGAPLYAAAPARRVLFAIYLRWCKTNGLPPPVWLPTSSKKAPPPPFVVPEIVVTPPLDEEPSPQDPFDPHVRNVGDWSSPARGVESATAESVYGVSDDNSPDIFTRATDPFKPAPFLPQTPGMLPYFLIYAGLSGIIHSAVCFLKNPEISMTVFSGPARPPPTALQARIYGLKNIYTGLIRLSAAYAITNGALYDLAMVTFAGVLALYVPEFLVFKTVALREAMFPFVTAGSGLLWMWLQRDWYRGL
ncbi:Retrotransposon-like family member [Mycena kentingensis (nom. inval.)]|nr:Retrotransposon-like family member [Mycena kentingensis (nom. inval.)]